MMGSIQHLGPLRGFRLAMALSVATPGGGIPMCLSLLAQALTPTPCSMHLAHARAATHGHIAQATTHLAQTPDHACHQDAGTLGCQSGTTCPRSGPATPAWATIPIVDNVEARMDAPGPYHAPASYLASPPSPPPQA